ncbi:conserved protein of unknown function [Tenacibaculum sp. 190524A02b]|uniref:hypothetical protein n=1 Tax=Tenacibaculum vairaonense TaxID=3137860 RepID=UPI0032B23DF1
MEVNEFEKMMKSKEDVEIINKKFLWKEFQLAANRNIEAESFNQESKCAFEFNEDNRKIVLTILRYFSGYDDFNEFGVIKNNPSLSKGLLVSGDLGVGKSILFKILSEAGRSLYLKTGFKRMNFKSISCGDFVGLYMASSKKKHLEFNLSTFQKIKLYIDDLGVEPKAFNAYELMEQVLFERYRNNALTFITTNLTPLEIAERYGARIGDRLPEMCNIIIWKGDSFRHEK